MTDNRQQKDDVGYGKPPQRTRFRKGVSGNPTGRAKGSKNVSKLLAQALSEPVVVNENGQRKQITKGEAMLKQLVNKGASGDARSIQLLLAEMRNQLESGPSEEARSEDSQAQLLMLERLTVAERIELRRLIAKAQGSSDLIAEEGAEAVEFRDSQQSTGQQPQDEERSAK
jgi:hypothetical protein